VTHDARAVLEALAGSLDADSVIEQFPGLDRETLAALVAEAAAKMPGGVKGKAAGRGKEKLIAYVDGAARGNPGEAGAGVVFKDASEEVVEKLSQYLGQATNNMAEYKALLLALKRAGELGATSLQVYSDSELLVHQINGRYRVRVPHLQKLCQEAIRLIRGFRSVNISHIPREKNAEADEQANIAIDQSLKG
jgi:ribonuclease HI